MIPSTRVNRHDDARRVQIEMDRNAVLLELFIM